MEITYSAPEPYVLWLIAGWFVLGVLGVIMMVVADRWAERRWGIEAHVVRPDYVLGGPLTFILGAVQMCLMIKAR